eukprot:596971-Hanusia_phi.AAC.1
MTRDSNCLSTELVTRELSTVQKASPGVAGTAIIGYSTAAAVTVPRPARLLPGYDRIPTRNPGPLQIRLSYHQLGKSGALR